MWCQECCQKFIADYVSFCPYSNKNLCKKCRADKDREFFEVEKFNSMLGD